MASQTLQWRVDRAKTMLRKLHASIDLSEQTIRLDVHLARNDVFRRYAPTREHLFRTTIVVSDGDYLPADWLRYADNATSVIGTYPVEYIPVEKIPFVKTQPLFKAYADQPKLTHFDQKIHTFPAGTQVNYEYIAHPVDLWKSDNSILLTQTDNMPQETEYAIVRGTVERSLRRLMTKENARQVIERAKLETESAAVDWYRAEFGQTVLDVQPFT